MDTQQKKRPAEKTNHHSHFIKSGLHLSRKNVRNMCKFVFCTKTNAVFYTTSQLEKRGMPCYIIDTKGNTEADKDP